MEAEALVGEVEAIDNAWYGLEPTWDQLFAYRDWAKFLALAT